MKYRAEKKDTYWPWRLSCLNECHHLVVDTYKKGGDWQADKMKHGRSDYDDGRRMIVQQALM